MSKRLTLKYIKEQFEKEGYTLLSKKYLNNRQKLEYICPRGHRHQIAWEKWQTGVRCFYCFGRIKKTIKEIKKSFEREGYVLLTEKYINAYQKLDYICPKGHKHSISWHHWKGGTRCLCCGGRVKKDFKEIQAAFYKEGYKLLTTEYKNCDQKLKYICPEGHEYQTSWDKWKSGRRCAICGSQRTGQINKILMQQKWADPIFQREMQKLTEQRWKDPIFQEKIYAACSLKPNKPEQALNKLLQNLFPNEYKYVGDFQFFIGSKNPDFMNTNGKKFLIELYGDYWHRNDNPQDRIDYFKNFGFDTFIIWEHELKDQEVLKSKLQNFHRR